MNPHFNRTVGRRPPCCRSFCFPLSVLRRERFTVGAVAFGSGRGGADARRRGAGSARSIRLRGRLGVRACLCAGSLAGSSNGAGARVDVFGSAGAAPALSRAMLCFTPIRRSSKPPRARSVLSASVICRAWPRALPLFRPSRLRTASAVFRLATRCTPHCRFKKRLKTTSSLNRSCCWHVAGQFSHLKFPSAASGGCLT